MAGEDGGLDLDSFWLNPLFNLTRQQAPAAAAAGIEEGGDDSSQHAEAAAAAPGLGGCIASGTEEGAINAPPQSLINENPLFKEPKGEDRIGCRRGMGSQRAASMGGGATSSSLQAFWGGECTCGMRETGVNQRMAQMEQLQARLTVQELELLGRQAQLDARESEAQERGTLLLTREAEVQERLARLAAAEAEAEERQRTQGEAAEQQQARLLAQALELTECRQLLEAAARQQEVQLELDLGKLSAQAALYDKLRQQKEAEWAVEQEEQQQVERAAQLEQQQQQAQWAMQLEVDMGKLSAQASARMLEGDRRKAELVAERALFDELKERKQEEWGMQLQAGAEAQVSFLRFNPCIVMLFRITSAVW